MATRLVIMCALTMIGVSGKAYGEDVILDAFAKSYTYEKTQNYEDAIKAMAILKDQDYLVHLRLGWLYYCSGNYANSLQQYQTAITAAPKAIEPRLGYMLPLLAQSRYAEVEATAKHVLMMDSANFYASLRLVIALRMQGKLSQAEEICNGMLELYPTEVCFLTQLGLVHLTQKNPVAAQRVFSKILALDPENVLAKRQLASLRETDTSRATSRVRNTTVSWFTGWFSN